MNDGTSVVTPPDNPAEIESLADLDAPDVDYVVCAETAPCGAMAVALLDDAGLTAPPASEEVDVKAVLEPQLAVNPVVLPG